jgi:hypothetical protein
MKPPVRCRHGERDQHVPKHTKSIATPRNEAHLYLAKAEQLVEEAHHALEGSRLDAARLNAIHAGISGADAVTVALAGRRSTDPDHQRAADLLEEVGRQSESIGERVKQLRALLGKKNRVEYESRRTTAKEATEAVARAERMVEWAAETVRRARL